MAGQVKVQHPRLDPSQSIGHVDLQYAVHPGGHHHHGRSAVDRDRYGAPGQTGTRPRGTTERPWARATRTTA